MKQTEQPGYYSALLHRAIHGFHRQSLRVITATEQNISRVAILWCVLLGLVIAARLIVIAGKAHATEAWFASAAVYALILLSPLIGLLLATRAFPRGMLLALPEIPLARIGTWKRVDPLTAQEHPHFGASGLMAGFIIGLLINIALRTSEFLAAVPAMASMGPEWSRTLFFALAADCIFFNIMYAAAFIMAIRHAPWFPRVMLLIWMTDILSQLTIAHRLGAEALPGSVSSALAALLSGNIKKSLISMALWMPYFVLSEKVNITYRRRVRMQD